MLGIVRTWSNKELKRVGENATDGRICTVDDDATGVLLGLQAFIYVNRDEE